MKTIQYRLVEELRREREAIDEVIAAYETFCDKLSRLSPEVVRRVTRMIEESQTENAKQNFERVADFLRLCGNQPQSARAIQRETMISRGALAFVLYTSHRDKFQKHEVPGHSRKKLWSLKENAEEPEPILPGPPPRRAVVLDGQYRMQFQESLAGRTSFECAKQILADNNNRRMHFGEIAREAILRGYVGKPSDEPLEKDAMQHRVAQSFWAMMHRAPGTFRKFGKGYFRLIEPDEEGAPLGTVEESG